jgi:hypothetical protein
MTCISSNIVLDTKLRNIKLAGHVARMGELRKVYTILDTLIGKEHLVDVGVDGSVS